MCRILRILIIVSIVNVFAINGIVECADITDLIIPEYIVDHANMQTAITKLRKYGIMISIETVRRSNTTDVGIISVELRNCTIGDILNKLVEVDKRYQWDLYSSKIQDYTPGKMIEVYPINAKDDPNDWLNIKVKQFKIANGNAGNVIRSIADLVPELAKRKAELSIHGIAGSRVGEIRSSMPNEMIKATREVSINMTIEDVTVRDILNEIALRSCGLCWLYETTINDIVLPVWKIF